MPGEVETSARRVLEHVSALEAENAALRAEIAEARSRALEQTVSTRRRECAGGKAALAAMLGVALGGLAIASTFPMHRAASAQATDPPPRVTPMPPTPPVYPGHAHRPPSQAYVAPPALQDCSTPYWVDMHGVRRHKPACPSR